MTIIEVEFGTERKTEKWKIRTRYDNSKWEEYKRRIKNNIKEIEPENMDYNQITTKIKEAAKVVRKKTKIKVGKTNKILGYNKGIKNAIKKKKDGVSQMEN